MSVRAGFLPKTGSPTTVPSTQRACDAAQEICFQKFQLKSEVFCWRGKIIHLDPCQESICSEDETPDPSQVTSQGPSPTLRGHQKLFPCMFLTSLKTGEVYGHEHLWPPRKYASFGKRTPQQGVQKTCVLHLAPRHGVPTPNKHKIQHQVQIPALYVNPPSHKHTQEITQIPCAGLTSHLVPGYRGLNFTASKKKTKQNILNPKKGAERRDNVPSPQPSAPVFGDISFKILI